MKIREEISAIVEKIKSDKKNLNLILNLIENLSDSNKPKVVKSLKGLIEVWQSLIKRGDYNESDQEDQEVVVKDEQVLNQWIKARFEATWNKILEFLVGDDQVLAEFAIVGVFRIIKAFHKEDTGN